MAATTADRRWHQRSRRCQSAAAMAQQRTDGKRREQVRGVVGHGATTVAAATPLYGFSRVYGCRDQQWGSQIPVSPLRLRQKQLWPRLHLPFHTCQQRAS